MKRFILLICFAMAMLTLQVQQHAMAQDDDNNASVRFAPRFDARLGINIGAATPTSIPPEIREIKGFNTHFNYTFEGNIWLPFSEDNEEDVWFLRTGVKIERIGMTTNARVKSYQTEVTQDNKKIAGFFTGDVTTDYSAFALTVPLQIAYRPIPQMGIHIGGYLSAMLNQEFGGEVSNGYMRKNTPVGEKVEFNATTKATYEFDDEMRAVIFGITGGIDWNISSHWVVGVNIAYSFSNIFNNDFKTISFSMHPIFFNLSAGYRF